MFVRHIGNGGLVLIVMLWSGSSPLDEIVTIARRFGWPEFGHLNTALALPANL